MTTDQIVTELRRIRYGQYPTITRVAKAAGISRVAVYDAIRTGHVTERLRQALECGLRSVSEGAVRQPPFSDRY